MTHAVPVSFRAIALGLMSLMLLGRLVTAQDSDVSGSVFGEGGDPIAGVSVTGMRHGQGAGYIDIRSTTAEDGRYQLSAVGKVLFFRKSGYRPFTRVRSPGDTAVNATLQQEYSGWKLQTCTAEQAREKKHYGSELLFEVSPGTRVAEGTPDTDNWQVFVLFPEDRRERMMIWSGPLLGGGFSYAPWEPWYLDGSVVSERGTGDTGAIDIRGEMPNGHRWRSVSWITDIAEYHDVSAPAAKFFDEVIDSACLRNR